jgi:hypothetical protein
MCRECYNAELSLANRKVDPSEVWKQRAAKLGCIKDQLKFENRKLRQRLVKKTTVNKTLRRGLTLPELRTYLRQLPMVSLSTLAHNLWARPFTSRGHYQELTEVFCDGILLSV